jgi:hypothetical protein
VATVISPHPRLNYLRAANRQKPLAFSFVFAVLASGAPDTIRTYDLGSQRARVARGLEPGS